MTDLVTPRLVLRRWRAEDIASMAAINSDPDVMRFIGDGSVRTLEETRNAVEKWDREWEERGYGLFAVSRTGDPTCIGFTGLTVPEFLPEVLPAVEIGWRLSCTSWGQGLATEAARAALDFGLTRCGLREILSICQVGNDPSERVMQKIGMHHDHDTVEPTNGRRLRIYAIEAAELSAVTSQSQPETAATRAT